MKIERFRVLIGANEIQQWIYSAFNHNIGDKSDWSLVDFACGDGVISLSVSKKTYADIRVPIDLEVVIRPCEDGTGIMLEIARMALAKIGVTALRTILLMFVPKHLLRENNCVVGKTGIRLDLRSIALKFGVELIGSIDEISVSPSGVLLSMNGQGGVA